jgi:hypothetical protein
MSVVLASPLRKAYKENILPFVFFPLANTASNSLFFLKRPVFTLTASSGPFCAFSAILLFPCGSCSFYGTRAFFCVSGLTLASGSFSQNTPFYIPAKNWFKDYSTP